MLSAVILLGAQLVAANAALLVPELRGEYLPPPPALKETYLPPKLSAEYLPPPPTLKETYLPPKLSAEYLPPPTTLEETYLPPKLSAEYLPPPKISREYLPPAKIDSEYLPPPKLNGEYLPPLKVESAYLPPPKEDPNKQGAEQSVVLDSQSRHGGYCPRARMTRSCLLLKAAPSECFSDVDCRSHQKCCSKNCQLQCVDAVVSPRSCDEVLCDGPGEECVEDKAGPTCRGHSKPGQCPYHNQYCANRIQVCGEDADCGGHKLCCNLGCHRLCVDPVSLASHQGLCPAAVSRPPVRCGITCTDDNGCESDHKCCENACGRVCQPGVVPFITCKNRNCPTNTVCEMQGLDAVCKDARL